MRSQYKLFLIVLMLAGCGKPVPVMEGVDGAKWKDDRNACLGVRQTMEAPLKANLEKLKGLSEMDIVGLLGRPDKNELYKRNQKFYYYYVTPGTPCNQPDSLAHKLIFRFNAMGYAQLVVIE